MSLFYGPQAPKWIINLIQEVVSKSNPPAPSSSGVNSGLAQLVEDVQPRRRRQAKGWKAAGRQLRDGRKSPNGSEATLNPLVPVHVPIVPFVPSCRSWLALGV